MTASGQQLQAINYLPGYNQTYANIAGGAAGLASIYGAVNQAGLFGTPTLQGWAGVGSPGMTGYTTAPSILGAG